MLLYITLLLISLWVMLQWKKRRMILLEKQLPSDFLALPIIGHIYMLLGNDENIMTGIRRFGKRALEKGGIISVWYVNTLYLVVADPVPAEIILKNCLQKDSIMQLASVVIGHGSLFAPLFKSEPLWNLANELHKNTVVLKKLSDEVAVEVEKDVSKWRPRRKAVAPVFSMQNLVRYVDSFSKQSCVLVDQLKSVPNLQTVSIWNYISKATVNMVCENTLGVKVQSHKTQQFLCAAAELFHLAINIMVRPWLHSHFIYSKLEDYKTILQHKRLIYDLIDNVIEDRYKQKLKNVAEGEEQNKRFKSIAELLVEANNSVFDNVAIREECMVILFAGTDTTAISSSFTTVLLAKRQDIQEKVVKELQEVFGDSYRPVEADDLSKLKYLEAVIKESLRLYPPAPVILRKIDKDVKLPSGIVIPKGCGTIIDIMSIHRNPEYWGEDADQFQPERFLDNNPKHPAAYMPFSIRPRGCPGYMYAMMSMKTILSTLLRQYRVTLPPDEVEDGNLRVQVDVLMRHVDGYKVTLQPREWNSN